MRSLAAIAEPRHAESLRRQLKDSGVLRSDLKAHRTAFEVAFPVHRPAAGPGPPGRYEEREFTPVEGRSRDYRELFRGDATIRSRLPRAFDVVGDVVLVRIPEELQSESSGIGAALLAFVPGCRVVAQDLGVAGPQRRRTLRRIAGSGGWTTVQHENGLAFEVDLEKAYFSPRLAGEHARVAAGVRKGDRVLDLCCGVGPFTLAIARDGRASRITAVDVNPTATVLLKRNLLSLRSTVPVEVVTGPLETFLPAAGAAERAIVNLPLEGIKYITQVGSRVTPGGVLTFYSVTPRAAPAAAARALLAQLPGPTSWSLEERRVVHPYSPRLDLVAFAFARGR
ncbi:MAG TPA: methyltransferase domain-containing protein [Thermoplasmata archaeon]|nr:methyltransferase domain-containing protein [Thermoplasmata archaeon]